jgi:hypothetical protein
MTAAGSRWALLTDRAAIRHFAEMVVAMLVGMLVLGPLWPELPAGAEPMALVMATDMTVGMTALMVWRRHRPVAVLEMLRRPAEYTCPGRRLTRT